MKQELKQYEGDTQNKILIDYLTIAVHSLKVEEVIERFCKHIQNEEINKTNFTMYEYGTIKGYDHSYRFLGENILNFNYSEKLPERMGVNINISGQGLKLLDKKEIINFIQELEQEKIKYNTTRCDLTYDNFNKTIPKNELIQDLKEYTLLPLGQANNTRCLTRIKNSSIQFYSGAFNQQEYENVTFGSRTGTFFARIYDKRAEQQYINLDYYERFELELRGDRAQYVILKLLKGEKLSKLFVDLLCSGIKIINTDKYNGQERNIKKVGLKQYFSDFLENILKTTYVYEKIKITLKKTSDLFLQKVNYVYSQLGTLLSPIHQTNSEIIPNIIQNKKVDALYHDKYSYYIKNCKNYIVIRNPFREYKYQKVFAL